jgi:hypothetical protein
MSGATVIYQRQRLRGECPDPPRMRGQVMRHDGRQRLRGGGRWLRFWES